MYIKFFFIPFIILITSINIYAWDKQKVIDVIRDAESLTNSVDQDYEIKEFIPYDYYSEALVNVRNAKNEMKKKQYKIAYCYASISMIKLKTAIVIADTRKKIYTKLLVEKNYYKKNTGDKNLMNIIEANLLKKGPVYTIQLPDKNIFKKNSYILNKRGKKYTDRIYNVLEAYPESKIKIVGHTGTFDMRNYSKTKARKIASFFQKKGIDRNRIEYIGAGNRIVLNTPLGFRRVNRIEIIISGIK